MGVLQTQANTRRADKRGVHCIRRRARPTAALDVTARRFLAEGLTLNHVLGGR